MANNVIIVILKRLSLIVRVNVVLNRTVVEMTPGFKPFTIIMLMLLSVAQNECAKPKCVTQPNLSNTDTEGTEQSVRIREVTMMTSLLRPQ